MTLAILILAAGQSSRMRGGDKLRQTVDGKPLLTVLAGRALATGLPVWITLPGLDHPRAQTLPPGVTPVPVPDAAQGMGASIRAGISALPDSIDATMILPADMPELTAADLCHMADTYAGGILRATSAAGTPGHPVVFPASLFAELRGLTGDEGARHVISANRDALHLIPLPDAHATTDLDTPEAWAAWRARQ
ncbi:nucleotidyltransferase family protein [Lacimonas salitolerans]|uniref:NTP transferase domain-containing protein n=1 Tax=Lacimonas salitolerans TaxID=1323750 RepID=A0ABW4EIG4_9RHOB